MCRKFKWNFILRTFYPLNIYENYNLDVCVDPNYGIVI